MSAISDRSFLVEPPIGQTTEAIQVMGQQAGSIAIARRNVRQPSLSRLASHLPSNLDSDAIRNTGIVPRSVEPQSTRVTRGSEIVLA